MLPEAIAAMTEELAQLGNPSSLHTPGRRARRVVEESREQIAEAFGARASEVVFTCGGTEADNLAVKGLFWARRAADPAARPDPGHGGRAPRGARLRALAQPTRDGARVDWLAVDRSASSPPTCCAPRSRATPVSAAVVSVMWANNEVGTVQPIAELAAVAHEYGVPVHTDAVQAAAQLPVDFAASGVDALTVTGHKLGGPVGVGALVLGESLAPVPLLHGGGQERDIRSGTLDMPRRSRAFAVAAVASAERRSARVRRADGGAARRPGPPGDCARCPTRYSTARRPARTGCPATPTSPSPAARATRC